MSLYATIRLVLPHEGDGKPFDYTYETGGGFRSCSVVYEVNPVGSKSLYRLVSVNRKGNQVDLDVVNRLNPPDCIDEAISAKFEAYKASQKAPAEVESMFRKKRVKKIPGAEDVPSLPDL